MKRKGVTPVIAVIMLLLIVIVLVAGVFAWMTMMQEDVERMGEEEMERFIDQAREYITFDTHNCEGDNITAIYLRNRADVEFHEDEIDLYIDDTLQDNGFAIDWTSGVEDIMDQWDDDPFDNEIPAPLSLTIRVDGDEAASQTFSC